MTTGSKALLFALAATLWLAGGAVADPESADAERALRSRLLEGADEEMSRLDPDLAIDELNALARHALEIERPDVFRSVMVSQVDPHWADLSDARTALNMIAWLPDTGEFLSARISAARIAISAGELPALETQRLWRDLRARVERVGEPDLLHELADAMIASGETSMLIETVERFHATDLARLGSYAHLLGAMPDPGNSPVTATLVAAIRDLAGDGEIRARSATEMSHALWLAGHHDEALALLEAEADPLERLRLRFRLLAEMPGTGPAAEVAGAGARAASRDQSGP